MIKYCARDETFPGQPGLRESLFNAKTGMGDTAAIPAIKADEKTCLQLLVQHGLKLQQANQFRWTPAHYAAEHGHGDILADIIYYGGHFDSLSVARETPAHRAARGGHLEAFTALLDAGADMWSQNAEGLTPPDLAVRMGRQEVVALLVASGFVETDHPFDDDHRVAP